ncbi:MAG TPA: 3-phosphoshikimate 1-carboxyvinyltransferase [Gemmatimonadaceae bacterium]|nr:3-phosphoshikimate 1-carboxyvinyltransferase [Gemmatimonadaceae bacterium]
MAALSPSTLTVRGAIRVPGDKSISHRALILSAVAPGSSRIEHILDSADVQSTAGALRAMGARIPPLSAKMYVEGGALARPRDPLDCGNSGTTTRLLAGVVAGAGLGATFIGDESLSRRPMRRVADPLRAMGARVELPPHGGLPMRVEGGRLSGIDYESSIASAQIKSAILLAAVISGVRARVTEPHRSRDHTERMLAARGVEVHQVDATVSIPPAQQLKPANVAVPADPSSAAFFIALGLLADAGELRLTDVCLNETRIGFLRVLQHMGASLELVDRRDEGGETVGTIVAHPSRLKGIEITEDEVPAMIDELPLFACIASRARGESVVSGAGELRVKESDRIKAIVDNLRTLGAEAEELEDGFRITGTTTALKGRVVTHGDHRIAMSFGILGATAGNSITVDDPGCVAVSFPAFWTELERVRS